MAIWGLIVCTIISLEILITVICLQKWFQMIISSCNANCLCLDMKIKASEIKRGRLTIWGMSRMLRETWIKPQLLLTVRSSLRSLFRFLKPISTYKTTSTVKNTRYSKSFNIFYILLLSQCTMPNINKPFISVSGSVVLSKQPLSQFSLRVI